MKGMLLNQWRQLQPRDRMILLWGGVIVLLILFYALIWHPWHRAISNMEESLEGQRSSLVWMREQSALLGDGGRSARSAKTYKGANQSLLAVVEQSGRAQKMNEFIQQLAPVAGSQGGKERVNVVLEEADFNKWVLWIESLYKEYGVNIVDLNAENDNGKPNVVELRITFERL